MKSSSRDLHHVARASGLHGGGQVEFSTLHPPRVTQAEEQPKESSLVQPSCWYRNIEHKEFPTRAWVIHRTGITFIAWKDHFTSFPGSFYLTLEG